MGRPAFPFAELLVFWAGSNMGSMVSRSASGICPVVPVPGVSVDGEGDFRVMPDEARRVAAGMNGQCRIFRQGGHAGYPSDVPADTARRERVFSQRPVTEDEPEGGDASFQLDFLPSE